MTPEIKTILLTGATGYVGGRLLKDLESDGHRVRCLVRRPELMKGRTGPATELIRSDLSHVGKRHERRGRGVLPRSRHGVRRGF
jgi:uncharacterized protein YbjT (DUF2867 family)